MFKRIGLRSFAIAFVALLMAIPVLAQQPWEDHCKTGLKQTVQYASAAATTTSLIAPVTGANVYICGYSFASAGGTGTIVLEYGTGNLCGTGTQALSATLTSNSAAGTSTFVTVPNHGFTQMDTVLAGATVPSQRICALTTGTIAQSLQLVYVQE